MLELKTVADVGLVGFPSAGKSSLVASVSAARPKIADYPFTTLVPNLGVVEAGSTRFTIADVPGLIPGASEGKGLGHEFLRHIERCAVLVHVLDCATLEPNRDPLTDLQVLEDELAAYGGLADRPRVIVLNKVDVPEARDLADLVTPELDRARLAGLRRVGGEPRGAPPALLCPRHEVVQEYRAALPEPEATRIVLRPTPVDDAGFTVTVEEGRFRVRGHQARAMGAPDRLQQRRGGRLPLGPAGPPRRRGDPGRQGCRAGRRGRHRGRRGRGRVRLRPPAARPAPSS